MSILEGSSILVTGGTGSFGKAFISKLLAEHNPKRVVIYSRDELKQWECRALFKDDPRLRWFIGDIRDLDRLRRAMHGIDYVVHAAALKQVPSCEFFPDQAVKTNVVGSANVVDAAAAAGVRSLVCLSTDKAVYPVNAMGMSKALMEKTAQAFARRHPQARTTVCITRYGNVMYSRGSVIPHFVAQIRAGRPMTVTDPGMTRFLMSLAESVDLVEYAFEHAEPGDLFVRKAPASTVETLARAVAVVMGVPDHPIEVIGTRHGEKRHETLLSREERATATDEGDYYRVPVDARSLQYEKYFEEGDPRASLETDYTSENTTRLDVEATVALLRTLPEIALLEEGR